MKTSVHLLPYLARFFLEWEMFQARVVEKIKTHILCWKTFSRKSCLLWDNVGKCGRARQATDDIIWRMRFACWITKPRIHTRSEYLMFIAFPLQQRLRQRASMYRSTYVACLMFDDDVLLNIWLIKFHCLTVHFDSLSFIHTNSCTFSYKYILVFEVILKSLRTL
jgi:hypothetical protein